MQFPLKPLTHRELSTSPMGMWGSSILGVIMTTPFTATITRREFKIAHGVLNVLKLSHRNRLYLLSNANRILGDEDGRDGLFNLFKEAQAETYQLIVGRPMGANMSDTQDEMMDRVFDILIESKFSIKNLRRFHPKNIARGG